MNITTPTSAAEMAEALAEANSKKTSLETGGNFSKQAWGGPVRGTQRISSSKLNTVLEYEPKDLTISVGAGMRWAEFETLLAGNGQMVPVDPCHLQASTVGGVVACNLGGIKRRLFGSLRDLIIGMKFATMEGRVVQSGGMVVKNVAGLDMSKLLIGSYGTLGMITSVNFKLIPRPQRTQTFLRSFAKVEELLAARDQILQGVLQPMALDAVNPKAAELLGHEQLGHKGFALLLHAGGSPAVISRYERELSGWQTVPCSIWDNLREFTPQWLAANQGSAMLRVPTTLQQISAPLGRGDAAVICRAATGISYVHTAKAADAQGLEVLEAGANGHKAAPRQWNVDGNTLATMQKIKTMLDPGHLLNEGRLYGRI